MNKTVRFSKIALFAATLAMLLCLSAAAFASETHIDECTWVYLRDEPATCIKGPVRIYQCSVCGRTKEETMGDPDLNNHAWGEWVMDSMATCTTAGQRHRQCARSVHHTQKEVVPALSHDLQWRVKVAATCTNTGLREQYCARCGQIIDTQIIPVGDHVWGPWTTLREPTCTEPGEQAHTCTVCGTTQNAPYGSALGHLWGQWQVITPATCESSGSRTRVCQRNASHVENEIIPCPGHKWTDWKIIKQPTFWEKGERERHCTVCGLSQTEYLDTERWSTATVCSFGPELRESNLYPYSSDRWYMFTPFDASMNGVQTYDLIVSEKIIVGQVTLTIRDGFLTVDYTLKYPNQIQITLEFFTVLGRIGELSTYEPEGLMQLKINRNQPINLNEKFPGDTHLVLYFCSRCSVVNTPYQYAMLNTKDSLHQSQLSQMLMLMD